MPLRAKPGPQTPGRRGQLIYHHDGGVHQNQSRPTFICRYSLNIKGLPYTTVWTEYPDIAGLCQKIGAAPTSKGPDGSPKYTLPVIFDPNTRTAVSESAAIARYLDKTYPDTPALIPPETDALHAAFLHTFAALAKNLLPVMVRATSVQLNPRSEEYFRTTREAMFGAKMEEVAPVGSEKRAEYWTGVEKVLHLFAEWLEADGKQKSFFLGEKVAFADIAIASFLVWVRVVLGKESKEWTDVLTWDGGRWARLIDTLKTYEAVDAGADAEV